MAPHFPTADTIVAIATPLGEGGLGVVRLSGPQALPISDHILQSKTKLISSPTHTLHHGWAHDQETVIDEIVVGLFRAPRSYTGEDVAEISCHGSPSVLKKIVGLCEQYGARLARPGEFTQRAFLNGKMDLVQAEAVAELIHAKSEKARLAATQQLEGQLSRFLQTLRQPLVDLLAHVEASLDFVEDDIPLIPLDQVQSKLGSIEKNIDLLLSMNVKNRWLREGIRVVLAGKPNVGKSSLFNALLSQDRAIVTEVPGTTRDTLEESVEWYGFPFVLVDTAGLRATEDIVESMGASRARFAQKQADIVLLVLDASEPITIEDKKIMDELKEKPLIVVMNKSDKGAQPSVPDVLGPVIATSARTHVGLSELKAVIVEMVSKNSPETESHFLTNERHVHHLTQCQGHIVSAARAIAHKNQIETIALDLRQAIEELSSITGENTNEDVLNSIFHQFCIGK